MANIYQRGEWWWIRYRLDGKTHRKPLKTKSKSLAKRLLNEKERELMDPTVRALVPMNPAIRAFWEWYEDYCSVHKRPGSLIEERRAWRRIVEIAKPKRIGDINRGHVEQLKREQIDKGNAPATVNGYVKDIKTIFNIALREEKFTGINPAANVKFLKLDATEPEPHTHEQLEHLLDVAAARGREAEWQVLLGGYAGMRKGEMANARWEWFEGDKNVHIQAGHGFVLKDHADRRVPLHPEIVQRILPHRGKGYLFEAPHWNRGKNKYRWDGKKCLQAALEAAGLDKSKPTQRLRQTFISVLCDLGMPIHQVARTTGHSNTAVLEKHYYKHGDYSDWIKKI